MDDKTALCVRRILASQDNPEDERRKRIKEDIVNMMFSYHCISNPEWVLFIASQSFRFKEGLDESLVWEWIDEVVRKNGELNGQRYEENSVIDCTGVATERHIAVGELS